MSRTIDEIFQAMKTEAQNFDSLSELTPPVIPDKSQPLLSQITSTSKVGIFNLLLFVQAVAIWIHEKLFDTFKADIEKTALNIRPANTRFYIIEALKFQLNDELVFIDGTFKFKDTTSTAASQSRVIKFASVSDINAVVTIKVATRTTPTSSLSPLLPEVKTSFENYINKIKVAGTKVIVISNDPDILKVAYTITFDPLVMKETGFLLEEPGATITPVQEAINTYIEGLSGEQVFRVQDLTDAIQLARGVKIAIADVVAAKFGALIFSDILAVPTETYLPSSGYLITDPSPIVVLTPDLYDPLDSFSVGNQTRFEGVVFEANQSVAPGESPATNPEKWETISNLTYIST